MLLMAPLLHSCAISPAEIEFCSVAEHITVGADDVLTDQTARQILKHDLAVARLCR